MDKYGQKVYSVNNLNFFDILHKIIVYPKV